MKRLILAAILAAAFAAPAGAKNIAYMPNYAGGRITLTDVECRDSPGAYVVYSTTTEGRNSYWGCWFLNDPDVVVNWNSGTTSVYPGASFIEFKSSRQAIKPSRSY